MNTDSYYEIGHSHTICEDYTLSGQTKNGLFYAIVCDGCSSSPDVDVGARIIAHCARDYLGAFSSIDPFDNMSSYALGTPIIFIAKNHIKNLGLPIFALDCTLVIAISDGTKSYGYIYGDGGIITKQKDCNCLSYSSVEFESGAPLYLSYLLDHNRLENYNKEFSNKVFLHHKYIRDGELHEGSNSIELKTDIPKDLYEGTKIISHNIDQKFISVVSDGIETYEKESDGKEDIDSIKMANDFMDYKNTKGQFVERRMKRIRKNCQKEEITHFDDISVSTICMGE